MLQREVNSEYQKWVRKLMGFDFEVQYKPGVSNQVADALTRKAAAEIMCGALITTMGVDWQELETEIGQETTLQLIKKELMMGEREHKGYHLTDGVLMYKGQKVIPKTSRFVPILLKEYHDSAMGGHAGEFKTYTRMAGDLFWVGMRRDVTRHVQQCGICQQ